MEAGKGPKSVGPFAVFLNLRLQVPGPKSPGENWLNPVVSNVSVTSNPFVETVPEETVVDLKATCCPNTNPGFKSFSPVLLVAKIVPVRRSAFVIPGPMMAPPMPGPPSAT